MLLLKVPAEDAPALDSLSADQQSVLLALDGIFEPLAKLCVAKGIRIQAIEEHLRTAIVRSARLAHPTLNPARAASRISASTGLTRREVTRLSQKSGVRQSAAKSPITELFTRWMSDPAFKGPDKKPMVLPRQGPAPSFESLANWATRDVHPRTLLDELVRLQIAETDPDSDTVRLMHDAFVPRGDWSRMLAFLGDNAGDHLRAAVGNVLQDGRTQLEQAIYADELSAESLELAREMMAKQWRALLDQVSPELERLIESDKAAARAQDQSMRIGMYTWSQQMRAGGVESGEATSKAAGKAKAGNPRAASKAKQ